MWFEHLTGFPEIDADGVRSQLQLDGDQLASTANGRSIGIGELSTPSLDSLRHAVADTGPGSINEIIGNVADLHKDPACAIACGGATIYRNYLAVVDARAPHELGQTDHRQIDCLADLGFALGNGDSSLWTMRNGYCLPSPAGIRSVSAAISAMTDEERSYFAGLLRIGVHANVEVTLGAAENPNNVTQVFGSALPVAYARYPASAWTHFAKLVLDASYEATLRAAHLAVANGANNRVFLTLLGGGAFGNEPEWIEDAVVNATQKLGAGLDLSIVSYRGSDRSARRIIERLAS